MESTRFVSSAAVHTSFVCMFFFVGGLLLLLFLEELQQDVHDGVPRGIELHHRVPLVGPVEGAPGSRHQQPSADVVGGSGHQDGPEPAVIVGFDPVVDVAVAQLLHDIARHGTAPGRGPEFLRLGGDPSREGELCSHPDVVYAGDTARILELVHELDGKTKSSHGSTREKKDGKSVESTTLGGMLTMVLLNTKNI